MSGFLGQILGGLTGSSASAAAPGLTSIVGQLLGGGPAGGGLNGLVGMLEQAGLGAKVQSWIGHGENHPVSPDELTKALPADQVQNWSQQAGMEPSALMATLSHLLPHAVNQATPDGVVPPDGAAHLPF